MEDSVFHRPHDLSDEATTFGYSEFEPFNETPSASASAASISNNNTRLAPTNTAAKARPRLPAARSRPPPKRDLMAYDRVVDMTTSLQSEQERAEALAKAAADAEAQRLRQERNAKWEAVKARMSAQPTPLHSVRAYDSDWSDSEEDDPGTLKNSDVSIRSVRSVRLPTKAPQSKRTVLDTLLPTLAEERAMRAGPLYAVESVPVRVCHFIYNWFMYIVYALSVSVMPGMDSRKGLDPNEYYHRKRYA